MISNRLNKNSDIRNYWQFEYIDSNIKELVTFLFNEFPKVRTFASCGGHQNPNNIQKPNNKWFIGFKVYKKRWCMFESFCMIVKNINEKLQNAKVYIEEDENQKYYFFLNGENVKPDKFLRLLKQEISKV
jgi:hypothetical protein